MPRNGVFMKNETPDEFTSRPDHTSCVLSAQFTINRPRKDALSFRRDFCALSFSFIVVINVTGGCRGVEIKGPIARTNQSLPHSRPDLAGRLAGSWICTSGEDKGQKMEIGSDGHFNVTFVFDEGEGITAKAAGMCEVKDGRFMARLLDLKFESGPQAPGDTKNYVRELNGAAKSGGDKALAGAPSTFLTKATAIKWQSPDIFVLHDASGEDTFKRTESPR